MEQISGRVDGRIRRQHRMPRVLIAFNMPQDVVELLAGYSERVGMAKVRVAELALRRFFAAEQEIEAARDADPGVGPVHGKHTDLDEYLRRGGTGDGRGTQGA